MKGSKTKKRKKYNCCPHHQCEIEEYENSNNLKCDSLRIEVEKFIQNAEEAMKINETSQEEEHNTRQQKKAKELNFIFKKLISNNNYDELFNYLLKKVKKFYKKKFQIKNISDYEISSIECTILIELYTKKNTELINENELINRRYIEVDNYKQGLYAKIKELNKEKIKIFREENEKLLEIQKKCENFKRDIYDKFNTDIPQYEKLQEKNILLKNKIEEIKKNLGNYFVSKDKYEDLSNFPECEIEMGKDNFYFEESKEKSDIFQEGKNKNIEEYKTLKENNQKMRKENLKFQKELKEIKKLAEKAEENMINKQQEFIEGKRENEKV